MDFRIAFARLVAALTRIVGPERLDLAEDAAQEALLRALRIWPLRGHPEAPEAWLLVTARNVLTDRLRRDLDGLNRVQARLRDQEASRGRSQEPHEHLPDDDLRLLFLCCHPDLPPEARVPLALKECCGFGVGEIASALRLAESTVAQRLVRAKRRLRDGGVSLELPSAEELSVRREDVRSVIYAVFNEGWSPAAGGAWTRVELVQEALRLACALRASAVGQDPATAALVGLLCLHGARLPARIDAGGVPVPLESQDRTQWDRGLMARGLRAFEASLLGSELTRWHVEASIASLHAVAPDFESTDWEQVLHRYDQLALLVPTAVVRLGRLVPLAMARGSEAALAELATHEAGLALEPAQVAATRGWILGRAGRREESRVHWERAASLATHPGERQWFLGRARA